jgi:serine/threonine protein kinase
VSLSQPTQNLLPALGETSNGVFTTEPALDHSQLFNLQAKDLRLSDLTGRRLNQYLLGKRIGQGGMGQVFEATHSQLGKKFAIKFLNPDLAASTEAIRRFQQEIRSIGQLDHPNLLQAVDAGEYSGIPFFVSELLCGHDAASWVVKSGRMNPAAACEIARQAALGLSLVHEHGFVHRDIKPSNLFVEKTGTVKVLDFGLAGGERGSVSRTLAGQFLGTVDFIAPEQASDSRQATPRSDLYSLGASLIYLLSGQPPFPDHSHPDLVSKLKAAALERPGWLASPDQPLAPEFAKILDALTAKDIRQRPKSAHEVARQLQSYACPAALLRWLAAATPAAGIRSGLAAGESSPRFSPTTVPKARWLAIPVLVIAAAAAPKLSGFTALSSKRSTATKTTPEPLSEVAASLTTRQLDTVHIRPKRTRSAGAIGLLHPEKFQASPQIRGEKR